MSQQEKGSHVKPPLSDPDCSVPLDETDVGMTSVHGTASQPEAPPIIDSQSGPRRMVQQQLEDPSSLDMDAADGVPMTEQREKKGDGRLRSTMRFSWEWHLTVESGIP
jgi:hypothetical protein